MQCMSKDIMLDMLDYIRHQAEFIIETTEDVKELNDFLCSQSGMVLYNSTCMCLQTIGETVRKIETENFWTNAILKSHGGVS